jgi:hypothetical protein
MPCVNKVLQLLVNLMTHDTNFSKITFINWSKVFKIPKHVFYDLFYTTTMSNTIKKMTRNVLATRNQPNDS